MRGGWAPQRDPSASECGDANTKKNKEEKEKLPFDFRDCRRDLSQWGD